MILFELILKSRATLFELSLKGKAIRQCASLFSIIAAKFWPHNHEIQTARMDYLSWLLMALGLFNRVRQ